MLRMTNGRNTRLRGPPVGVAVGVGDGVSVGVAVGVGVSVGVAVGVGVGVAVGVGVGVSVGVGVGVAVGVAVGVGVFVGGGAQDSDQASSWGEALPSPLLSRAASRSDGCVWMSIALRSAPLGTSAQTVMLTASRTSTLRAEPLGTVAV